MKSRNGSMVCSLEYLSKAYFGGTGNKTYKLFGFRLLTWAATYLGLFFVQKPMLYIHFGVATLTLLSQNITQFQYLFFSISRIDTRSCIKKILIQVHNTRYRKNFLKNITKSNFKSTNIYWVAPIATLTWLSQKIKQFYYLFFST